VKLVLRRARGAKTLLLAAVAAALISVAFVVGLLDYGRDVVSAASRSTVSSAPPEERSVLVRGAADAGGTSLVAKDAALRRALAGGVGGRPVTVWAAGYSVGRQLSGSVGSAVGDTDGVVYGNVVFLDDLPDHADLVAGTWARPAAATTEVSLARAAAAVLGMGVGDRMPITDRRGQTVTEVLVVGIWQPRDPADPYWLLVPHVTSGRVPGGSTYGPMVMTRDDFLRGWATDASVGWIVQPELTGVGLAELVRLQQGAQPIRERLGEQIGLGGSGQVETGMDRLVDRLTRADLVGRSALLIPVLLIVVLCGYTLLLIAMLLNQHRRGETALIRARGAGRLQIAGLAAREAGLIVLPALLLGPPLATVALAAAGRLPVLADASLRLSPRLGTAVWSIAAAAALLCLVAMVGPSLRHSATFVEELGAQSRPGRLAFAQRASLDLALVALALLAWFQLRLYASPLAGRGEALGIDPLLVAAPTVGVLAGAVVSLRALPWLTRIAERVMDRRHAPATMLGMWQAGRRAHAGPVLLVSLAVAVSTLAWSLLGTAERSLSDQADFEVGADLRLVEANGFAPAGRTEVLAALPGVVTVAPVSRDTLRLGPDSTTTAVVGIDPVIASRVVRYRGDLLSTTPDELFDQLARARPALPVVALPAGAVRFEADLSVSADEGPMGAEGGGKGEVATTMTVLAGDGHTVVIPLGTVRVGQPPSRVDVALPRDPTLSVVRFDVRPSGSCASRGGPPCLIPGPGGGTYHWRLIAATTTDAHGNVSAAGLGVAGGWQMIDLKGEATGRANPPAGDPTGLEVLPPAGLGDFGLAPTRRVGPVPVAATAGAIRALRSAVGQTVAITVSGVTIPVLLVSEVSAIPGTTGAPAAMLADLASLSVAAARVRAVGLSIAEHWLTAAPAVADEARALPGLHVLQRTALAATAGREPYGVGARSALFAAALEALLLALIGIGVDVRATARRRVGEFAVLQTMGAGSRLLARSVLAEQAFLAGLGVLVGLVVGVGVAATMAPLIILTPTADRPEPVPVLAVPWLPALGTAGALFLAVMALTGAVAARLGRPVAIARRRIGDDR